MKASSMRSYFSLLASLLGHALLVFLVLWFSGDKMEPVETPEDLGGSELPHVIQVRSMTPEDLRRIVQTSQAQDDELADGAELEKTPFLAEQKQRVEKQTRASGFGSTSGGTQGSQKKTAESGEDNGKLKPDSTETEEDRLARLSRIKGLWELPAPERGGFQSFSGDSLLNQGSMDLLDDSIAVSSKTLLNTDEYRYASFFNRVKEAIAPRWEPRVQVFLSKTLVLGEGMFSTKCAFWLDSEGVVQRVEVIESSGSDELDLIARQSIVEVGQFANPPDSLMAKNGMHRVELGFLVDATKPRVRTDYLPDSRFMPHRSSRPGKRVDR